MDPEPLSEKIFEKAKALGVTTIMLNFSGGSDEGYLHVDTGGPGAKIDNDLHDEIYDWAWDVYEYSGAGVGDDYGDDITYHLDTMQVVSSGWYMARHDDDDDTGEFELAEDEE